ncbi:MAG TPA: TIGR02444 family protein [Caulobacteraceae bacterium]|nr:TIGR02444 family protein [Caulobacteraceae bacterium]
MSLWERASRAYESAEVERLCLVLQDDHRQCVSYLLWAIWAGEQGRPVDAALAGRAAALARDWDESVLKPLRAVRRRLKSAVAGISDSAREASRERLKDEEIAAERLLLDALEAMTPAAGRQSGDVASGFRIAQAAWPTAAPDRALAELADAFSRTAFFAKLRPEMSVSDDLPLANDEEAIQARIAELRQAHQDLDAAITALSANAMPDQLRIARLKKQKLALRDQISRLEDRLTPDIIA